VSEDHFYQAKDAVIVSNDDPYLERRELNSHLERIIESPLITVVAGEGYGKTYSLYSFLRTQKTVAVWIQISERDNLRERFWENYTGAIGLYDRETGKILADIGFPETNWQFDRYMTVLYNRLLPQRRYIQVFDDFHLIREPPVLRLMDRYFAAPLPNLTSIMLSRQEPAINSVSLLSKGSLSQITVDELRFTERETGEYFALQNIELSPEETARIHHDSEGWALAIGLAAREMKHLGPEKRGFTRNLLEMSTFRSMEDDLLMSMSGDLRKFLIKLSLIEHWSLELLEKLAPDKRIIEEMKTFGPFIRYDTYLCGYRIHHIFLSFLKDKQGELSWEEIRDVYRKDAAWCIENNLRMDAALDYERARDYRGLVNLINTFPRVVSYNLAVFFLEIIDRLLVLDPTELPAREDEAYEDFAFLRYVLRPRLFVGQGRLEEAEAENRRSIAVFESEPSSPLSSRILVYCYNSLGALKLLISLYTRDTNITCLFEQANKYYMRHPDPPTGTMAQCCIGTYANRIAYPVGPGEIDKVIREIIPLVAPASNSFNGFLYGMDTLLWAEYYYFCADLTRADNFARQSVFKAREKNQGEVENRGLCFLLRINLYTGNSAGIEEVLKQLEAQLENDEFLNRYILYDIVTGWFYAHIGQTGKMASWLKDEFEESELNIILHGFETLVKAKYFFAEKRYGEAVAALNRPGSIFGLGEFLLGRLEMKALQAAAYYNMGEKARAFAALEEAWETAASNHLDMAFIELGEDMYALAGEWLAEKTGPIPRSWLLAIRSKASVYAKKLALVVESLPRQAPAVTLSFREMRVLTGLSKGLTREEIADKGAMSLNTVKNIISGIYAKLGAVNRADAIRIATNTDLLKIAGKE
jgi:LuxR family maltose regulon positive regulatory protein